MSAPCLVIGIPSLFGNAYLQVRSPNIGATLGCDCAWGLIEVACGGSWRYVRYNLGTVAFGSFIIAIVQMIRIVFNYFVNKADQFKDNEVVKAVVCLVNCCL